MRRVCAIVSAAAVLVFVCNGLLPCAEWKSHPYDDFEKPQTCGACHQEIFLEWQNSMMAHAYTHSWDEIEYFKLALPQSEKDGKVRGVREGCIGCHSPLAFLSGDTPPPRPSKGSRANEGVSCDVCHTITGSAESEPFNFSYLISPGKVKYGPRKDVKEVYHKGEYSEFITRAEFCSSCHDEQSPFGAWVKSTYREWKAGPYAGEGTQCHDCHIHFMEGTSAVGGVERNDIAHHVFQGAHNPSKICGVIDLALYSSQREVVPGEDLLFDVVLFNGKAGHKVPTGSAEERQLWLHVEAIDARGGRFHIPVNPKGFEGEEYTLTSHALSYQDIGEIMDIKGFKGLPRDGEDVPEGDRIFRKPFFDPKGRMTICQWNTAENERVDYRIGPREMKEEHYTWRVPDGVASGKLEIVATLNYRLLPSSVAKFLEVPEEEYATVEVNENTLELAVR